MRVLHLHKLRGVGGSERHLLALLPALRERGVDARLLGLDAVGFDSSAFYRELQALGVPCEQVPCRADVDPRLLVDVARTVARLRPALLHTHLVHADVYGVLASLATRTPVVSTRHNDDRYLLGPFRYVDRAFASRTRRLIAISDAVRRFLIRAGHRAERVETIHYGLDLLPPTPSEVKPHEAGIPEDAPLLLAIGRLVPQKDHASAVRALALVRQHAPEARLAILGGGPLEAQLRALARSLNVADALVLPGRVEIRDWLERASLLVHPSRWEGFGMVQLEAMLAGLAIVATRVSAIPEVVEDGVSGRLVDPGDAEGLAAAILPLLEDPQAARRMGAAGRARARERFSVAGMAERTHALYGRTLSGPPV